MAVRAVDERGHDTAGRSRDELGHRSRVTRGRLLALLACVAVLLAIAGTVAAQFGPGVKSGSARLSVKQLRAVQARVAAAAPALRASGIELVAWSAGIGTDGRENLRVRNLTGTQLRELDRLFGARNIRVLGVGGGGA